MADEVTIDLTNYLDRSGALVPDGRYRVIVDSAEESISRNTGNPMITLWLKILEGEHSNAVILDRLVLTEKSMFRVVAFLQAVNIPTPKKSFRLHMKQIIGKVLEIDVEEDEPYLGTVKSGVRRYLKVAGGGALKDPLEEEGAEAPRNAYLQAVPAAAAAPQATAPAGINLDDLNNI